jgi:molecular chaperone GrpE
MLLGLEKQVGRAGREQLKTNSIAELQAVQLTAALEQLRAADARRDTELAALREQSRDAQAAARLHVAQTILPALDGLDEALRAGRLLLATAWHGGNGQQSDGARSGASEDAPGGWLRRLLGGPPPGPVESARELSHAAVLRDALDSWLRGLTFVRQRLLDVLAAEDVRPIAAVGQPFDPRQHVAIGVVAATESQPPGIVAEELRRGYLAGQRVLCHAEVVVASGEEHQLEEEQEGAQA